MTRDQESTYKDLFRSQYPRLYHFALQVTHDEEASRDIVSETFAKLWQGWSAVEADRAPYMLTVLVRRRCVDLLRHRCVHSKYVDYYLHAVDEAYSDSSDNVRMQREVAVLMDQLQEPTKTVLEKCYLEHKKYAEVAQEMHLSHDMVKRHVSKALRILREKFGGKNPDDIVSDFDM
ncbi:MAG: sigma-70 family RNA polymerase sigma factor [Prevotella sp.]